MISANMNNGESRVMKSIYKKTFLKGKKRIISILLMACGMMVIFPNYMFFEIEPVFTRWRESFPTVNFNVNSNIIGLNAPDSESQISKIKDAARNWHKVGQSRFTFVFKGNMDVSAAFGPETISCTDAVRLELSKEPGRVFASNIGDPDCTGMSCTFLWTCDKEILHFDVELNNFNNNFSTANPLPVGYHDLFSVMLHAFGHAAGLDHCSPGSSTQSCMDRQIDSQIDPILIAAMHKFQDAGVGLTEIAEDDINGLRALYGIFENPFPPEGKYALSEDEIEGIGVLMTRQTAEGHDTPVARQMQARMVFKTYQFVNSGEINRTLEWVPVRGYIPGMTVREYFDMTVDTLKNNLGELNDLQIEYMRKNLAAAHVVMDDVLKKYSPGDGVPSPSEFHYINQRNDELRRVIIDEQITRGGGP